MIILILAYIIWGVEESCNLTLHQEPYSIQNNEYESISLWDLLLRSLHYKASELDQCNQHAHRPPSLLEIPFLIISICIDISVVDILVVKNEAIPSQCSSPVKQTKQPSFTQPLWWRRDVLDNSDGNPSHQAPFMFILAPVYESK